MTLPPSHRAPKAPTRALAPAPGAEEPLSLRARAEALLGPRDAAAPEPSPEQLKRLAHDLSVYQVELELQNEELQAAASRLDHALGQYAQLYHHAPVGYLTLDVNGVILHCNQTFLDLAGTPETNLAGTSLASLLASPGREIFLARYRALFSAPDGKVLETQLRLPRGRLLDLRLTGRLEPARDAKAPGGPAPARLLIAVNDVTAEKKAELALRNAHQFSDQVIRSAQEGVVVYARDLRYTAWNPYLETLTGLSAAEVLGRHPLEVFPFVRDSQVMARLEEALAGGVGGTTDVRFFFERTGRSGWTTNRYAPFRNADGDIAGVIGTITDITDRILAQEQMLRFNENLEAQVRLRTQELAQRDAAMEAASDAMAIIDLEGVLRWANPAFGSLTGYRPEEAKGRPIRMLNSGRQDRAFFSGLWATILAGRVWQDELVNRRKDGSEYLESQTITPVPGADGTITHFVAIKRDVTGQRAAENRLRKLSQVVEESPGAVVITDTRGVIEYVNPSFTELTGYAAEEVLGGNPRILKSDLTPPQVFEDLWATILAGRIWRGELANAAKDGRLFWEKITISPLFGRDGTLTHFVAHTEDITAQRLLEENRQRLAAALEQAEDAAAILNRSGQIIFANSAFHRVLGATDRQVLGEPIGTFLEDPEQPERLAGMLAQVLDGRAWKGRHTIRTAAGARLILDGTLSPVHELEGEASSIALVFRDMTREIQRGRELIQAQKMDSLGALAGGVAHDFNNLLSSILIAAELIEWELPEDSPIRARLDIIYQVARQARELNRQILSFSRRSEDRRVPFNLTKVVQEAGTLLKATLPRGVTLHSELAAALWITGDPAQANQVVMNLAINGAQAIGAGEGRLTLTLAEREVQDADGLPLPAGRYAELCVQDDGTGMDAATLERIFEPFFTTKDAEGTGLGLSVVHGIVHGHGGHLRVESAPGQGTAFWIYLPMGPTRGPADAAPEAREYRGGERILLVDDEDIVAALSRQGLEALGYQVVAKTSPADALALFRARPGAFDLLITDLSLTEFSGDELTRRIRELRPGLPAILLSGSPAQATPGSVPVAFDAVLAKPLTPRELGAAIRRVMDASARAPEECERRTVLLAEDNPTSRVLLRSWLTKAGYLVQEARDGQEAWELFSGTRPDLLLTDIVMPRLDGLGLVARVRAAAPRFPVIILSSLEETEAAGHATRLQVDAFLQKPFDSRALLAALRRLLAGG